MASEIKMFLQYPADFFLNLNIFFLLTYNPLSDYVNTIAT